jgi:hypothetical protein
MPGFRSLRSAVLGAVSVYAATPIAGPAGEALPRLRASDNRRFVVTADGRPFFCGPMVTAWWLNPRDGHATRIGGFESSPAPR